MLPFVLKELHEKAFVVICINFVLAAILYMWHCWGGGKEEGGEGKRRGEGGKKEGEGGKKRGREGRKGGREGGGEGEKEGRDGGGMKGESEGRREGGRRGGVKIIFVFDNFLMQLDSKGSVSGSYS